MAGRHVKRCFFWSRKETNNKRSASHGPNRSLTSLLSRALPSPGYHISKQLKDMTDMAHHGTIFCIPLHRVLLQGPSSPFLTHAKSGSTQFGSSTCDTTMPSEPPRWNQREQQNGFQRATGGNFCRIAKSRGTKRFLQILLRVRDGKQDVMVMYSYLKKDFLISLVNTCERAPKPGEWEYRRADIVWNIPCQESWDTRFPLPGFVAEWTPSPAAHLHCFHVLWEFNVCLRSMRSKKGLIPPQTFCHFVGENIWMNHYCI